MKDKKKGQMMTFDFSTSIILFIMFIMIVAIITLLNQKVEQSAQHPFELEYTFTNFEKNLAHTSETPAIDFIHNYRVNYDKLKDFSSTVNNIDKLVLENIDSTQGIGMFAETYDVCMYVFDNDGTHLDLDGNGKIAVGEIKNGISCDSVIKNKKNPCNGYEKAISFFKPVLLDVGDEDENRIVQMNLVMCLV